MKANPKIFIRVLFVLALCSLSWTVVRKVLKGRAETAGAEAAQAVASPELAKLLEGQRLPADAPETPDEALENAEAATPMFRFSKNLFPSREVHKLSVRLATSLIKSKEPKTAKKILSDVLRYEPRNPDILNNLAFLVGEEGDWGKAEEYLRKSVEVPGKCPECHNNLGNILVRQGKLQEAKGQFEKAVAIEPRYLDAHLNLALLLEELNDWGGAMEWYKKSTPLVRDPEMRKMVELRGLWMEEITQGKRAVASTP